MSTDTKEPTEQQQAMDHLRSRMKVQRVYNNANTLANLSDRLLDTMSDNRDIVVNNEEMDKLNEEIEKLQDRLIKAVGEPSA